MIPRHMSFTLYGKDIVGLALVVGLIAIVVIFVPVTVLLMGLFAFVIGLLNFLKYKKDNLIPLVTMIIGLVVVIVCAYWNYLR